MLSRRLKEADLTRFLSITGKSPDPRQNQHAAPGSFCLFPRKPVILIQAAGSPGPKEPDLTRFLSFADENQHPRQNMDLHPQFSLNT
jgi:hypothetical protein